MLFAGTDNGAPSVEAAVSTMVCTTVCPAGANVFVVDPQMYLPIRTPVLSEPKRSALLTRHVITRACAPRDS